MISNCGAPIKQVSEFLDFQLKSIMQNGGSYIKNSNGLKRKAKNIDIPNGAVLLTADVVGLYPSIAHEVGLSALREALVKKKLVKKYLLKILLKWQNLF